MGNRAFVYFEEAPELAVALHWNGGSASVLAFTDELKRRSPYVRNGEERVALFYGLVTDFFTFCRDIKYGDRNYNNMSVRLLTGCAYGITEDGDNGVYFINSNCELRKTESGNPFVPGSVDDKGQYDDICGFFEKLHAAAVAWDKEDKDEEEVQSDNIEEGQE